MSCVESRNVTITATRDAKTADGVKFTMSEDGKDLPNETLTAKKTNSNKASDYHKFTFTLVNRDGLDLEFVDNPFDVMWVTPGNNCPKHRSHDMDFNIGEIGRERLVVHNANSRACDLKFVLNFVGTRPDGKKGIIGYDPVWSNGNGGMR